MLYGKCCGIHLESSCWRWFEVNELEFCLASGSVTFRPGRGGEGLSLLSVSMN